ncbi:RNA polymerase sigma factor [Pedobacter insulae]|uniref:RNA polymerase sigma-70 factor, Bacteroides expansion family 1 n=1 Tax=Pedobacter insulae TaxID=414048 RepID=A0A1I2ZXV2_9SPHI|nr:sigma-70 family RNA polymerase sigma factor [Pedobacter insulae]SFH42663.1 RNA polymerase sigma-70 factor, Bacteroides expansion family 1 [Pedobacter insulae]
MLGYQNIMDQELAVLLRSGDDAAFREIYLRYDKLLYLYAYKKLRNREEAMDVVQDVFAWLLNNRDTFVLKTTLSGYLYKSVLNRVFDIYRHRDIIRQYVDSGDYHIEVDSNQTDYLIREKDIAELIKREIAGMPARMREIYELKRMQYLTTKQIAAQLELSEHTVSTQLKRAMKHLKTRLGIVVFILFVLNR